MGCSIAGALALMVGGGCGSGSSDTMSSVNTQPRGTIEGRLEVATGIALDTTLATVLRMNGDGSMTSMMGKAAGVGDDGSYHAGVDLSGGAIHDLTVRIDRGGDRVGAVLLAGSLEAGETRIAAPVNRETTLEADSLMSARASGVWQPDGSIGLLRYFVSGDLAAAVDATGKYDDALPAIAEAVAGGVVAWQTALTHDRVGVSRTAVAAADTALTEAQAGIDQRLHEATTPDVRSAVDPLELGAVIDSSTGAGIAAGQLAVAAHAMAESARTYSELLPDEAGAALEVRASAVRAQVVTHAVGLSVTAAGFDQSSLDQVTAAATELDADIFAAVSAPTMTRFQLAEAWTRYMMRVEAELDTAIGVSNDAYLDAKVAAHVAFDNLDDTLDNLTSAMSPLVSATVAADAYATFYSEVGAQALRDNLVTAGYSAPEAQGIVETLANINAGAR